MEIKGATVLLLAAELTACGIWSGTTGDYGLAFLAMALVAATVAGVRMHERRKARRTVHFRKAR